MAVTWNPADKNAGIALSGSNLIATGSAGSGTVNQAVRATQAISAATKQYFEVSVSGTLGQYFSVGVMDTSTITGNVGIGNPGTGATWMNKFTSPTVSRIFRNGAALTVSSYPALSSGQTIRLAVDRTVNRAWWAINNNTWSGSAVWMDGTASTTADPATGTGGLDISAVTGNIFPAFASAWTGDVATINGGDTAFSYAVPSGFHALTTPVAPLVNTFWSQSDKVAGITLSNSNLTATLASAPVGAVRTVSQSSSGKTYWEVTLTTIGTSTGIGIMNATMPITTSFVGSGAPAGTAGYTTASGGVIWVNGINVAGLGTAVNGNILCFAVDLDNGLLWIRIGPAGNWNNSGSANPATGAGGLAHSFGSGLAMLPAFYDNTSVRAVTANFGASAFSGVVPGGFTSGFPSVASAGGAVAQARAMVLA